MRLESETRAEYKRRWQRENKDKVKAARDKYQSKNRKLVAERSQIWRKNNPEFLKERRPHWHRKSIYGLKEEEYEEKFKNQNGLCAICQVVHKPGRRTSLAVDHCHKTNRIRGLICHTCNRGLGLLRDNIDVLKSAIKYLEKYEEL